MHDFCIQPGLISRAHPEILCKIIVTSKSTAMNDNRPPLRIAPPSDRYSFKFSIIALFTHPKTLDDQVNRPSLN